MTKTDTSPEAVERLAGVLASRAPHNTVYDQNRAADTLRAQAERIKELEEERDTLVACHEMLDTWKQCARNAALRELRQKWLVRDLTEEDFRVKGDTHD